MGTNFHELAFDHKNHEISASRKFPAMRYLATWLRGGGGGGGGGGGRGGAEHKA